MKGLLTCLQVSPFGSGLDFLVFLAASASLELYADFTESLPALEATEGTMLLLLLPVGPQQHQPHHSTSTPLPAAGVSAAATAAAPAALLPSAPGGEAAAAAAETEEQRRRLDLPTGTIAAVMPSSGLLFVSGVPTGEYRVALVKARRNSDSRLSLAGSRVGY